MMIGWCGAVDMTEQQILQLARIQAQRDEETGRLKGQIRTLVEQVREEEEEGRGRRRRRGTLWCTVIVSYYTLITTVTVTATTTTTTTTTTTAGEGEGGHHRPV